MRVLVKVTLAAALSTLTIAAANAQIADQRSFLHPLGFWSNDYFVAQKQVYPRFHYAKPDADLDWSTSGGWVLHERNW